MKQLQPTQLALVCGGGVISVSANGIPAELVGIGASIPAIGAAVGADAAITTAGGLGALGASAAIAAGSAYLSGVAGAGYIGYALGGAIYNNSETVQGVAQNMLERFMEGPIDAVVDGLSDIWGMLTGQGSYAPPSGGAAPTANSQNTLVVPH